MLYSLKCHFEAKGLRNKFSQNVLDEMIVTELYICHGYHKFITYNKISIL